MLEAGVDPAKLLMVFSIWVIMGIATAAAAGRVTTAELFSDATLTWGAVAASVFAISRLNGANLGWSRYCFFILNAVVK